MKEIPLTQGKIALVDDDMYDCFMRWSWSYASNGYAKRRENGKTIFMHKEVIRTDEEVDHINGNKLCNLRANLRVCTHSQNNMNKPKRQGSKNKYKGVYRSRDDWRVMIQANGVRYEVGTFTNEDAAANAYNEYAKELHGEFANLNDAPQMDDWMHYKKQ